MTYRCEVPGCGSKVRVVCDRGHAYTPHEDGAQVLVPGTEPPAPVDATAVARAAEAARMGAPVLTPEHAATKAADNDELSRRVALYRAGKR